MQIMSSRSIEGPNIYSHNPVLKVTVDIGDYEEIASNALEGFVQRLLQQLPGLYRHHCSRGREGGFAERLHEGTYLAHIFEHVAIELQYQAGHAVSFGKTRSTGQYGIYDVIIGCQATAVSEEATRQALKLLHAVLNSEEFSLESALIRLRALVEQQTLGPSTRAILAAAEQRGIPVRRVADTDLLVLGYGCRQKRIWATISGQTSALAVDLAGDKFLTKIFLRQGGLIVPDGQVVRSLPEAEQVFSELSGLVAVKPLTGNHGRGVTLRVETAADLRQAFARAQLYGKEVLLEEYVVGREYRLCIVGGNMVAAAERIPAYVVGDGRHTVAELVEKVNQDPRRGEGHTKELTRIMIDEEAKRVLSRQGFAVSDIPAAEQLLYIRDTANLSTGGTSVDVTAIVHPVNRAVAEQAARLIGLDVAGVDLVTDDITKPMEPGRGAVLEVNAAPGIRMHHYPAAGTSQPVAERILDTLFPPGTDGRIPIIAVTGTNGKTTITRMISRIWQEAGYTVGMTTTDGVYLNTTCRQRGDTTGPDSARMVLDDPQAEVAVLETARGGLLRGGLAFDHCDVAIITNITEDHLGQDGIETLDDLVFIKSLLAEVVKPHGFVLLDADDVFSAQIARRAAGQIVYVSQQPNSLLLRRHLGIGGRGFFVEKQMLYAACGSTREAIVGIQDIPAAWGGKAAHNVQNALMAAAACYLLRIPPGLILQGLNAFAENPGRLTMLRSGDITVCVDYAHNPAGYRALIATVRQWPARHLIGVIAAPGDRRDDVTIAMGRIAGAAFSYIYIKEDSDLRGRQPGETASLLQQGVLASGFPAQRLAVVLTEYEAVTAALAHAQAGDLVVICYEHFEVVMSAIQAHRVQAEAVSNDDLLVTAVATENMIS